MARVLVVDDNPSTVTAMRKLLEGDGHAVAAFTNAASAIDAIRSERFDVVVSDFELPAVDAHAVLRAVGAHSPSACRVVISARARENAERLVRAGACLVADKPLAYEELADSIARCGALGGRGHHAGCPLAGKGPCAAKKDG